MADMSDYDKALDAEDAAIETFLWICDEYSDVLSIVGQLGDGQGGYIIEHLRQQGVLDASSAPSKNTKSIIPAWLKKAVFERDAYRCQRCGGWQDLCADHVFPESKGGETTEENLQTLCRPCNSAKGNRSA